MTLRMLLKGVWVQPSRSCPCSGHRYGRVVAPACGGGGGSCGALPGYPFYVLTGALGLRSSARVFEASTGARDELRGGETALQGLEFTLHCAGTRLSGRTILKIPYG